MVGEGASFAADSDARRAAAFPVDEPTTMQPDDGKATSWHAELTTPTDDGSVVGGVGMRATIVGGVKRSQNAGQVDAAPGAEQGSGGGGGGCALFPRHYAQ